MLMRKKRVKVKANVVARSTDSYFLFLKRLFFFLVASKNIFNKILILVKIREALMGSFVSETDEF